MRRLTPISCLVDGCESRVLARGLCRGHYASARRGTIPLPPTLGSKLETTPCAIDGCKRPYVAKGLCRYHYERAKRLGSPIAPSLTHAAKGVQCSVDGCSNEVLGAGLCHMHYERRRRTGDVGTPTPDRNPRGAGTITWAGYRKVVVGGKHFLEHRAVMEQKLGRKLLQSEQVHHIDGNKLNNSPDNLELWTRHQPTGQRLEDRIEFAKSVLKEHGFDIPDFDTSAYLSGSLACI